MATYKTISIGNKWRFKLTPTRYVLIFLGALAIFSMVYRLVFGLGAATNLNDQWPWGLWIGFDVLIGVALAGGGYSTALLVHIFGIKKFSPLARAALLTSLIGYILVMIGLFMDIGRWFNFWVPFVSWGYTSILFEVFWCVALYTTVQMLEFGEIATEKVMKPWHGIFIKIMPALLIIGVLLPTLHQSSLGSLYVMEVGKLYPLWWSLLLPLFFLMSSFFVGPAMITIESVLGARAHGHKADYGILQSLIKISGYMMLAYLIIKIVDLYVRGALGLMFLGNVEGNMFLLEMAVGIIIPLIICFTPRLRSSKGGLVTFGVLVVGGVILNRANVVFTGMANFMGGYYFPSWMELSVTIGLVAIAVLLYLFAVENFRILPEQEPSHQPSPKGGRSKAATGKPAVKTTT